MPASQASGSRVSDRTLLLLTALAAALLGVAAARAQVPSFQGVGDLAGGADSSAASDVSADGTVVVGRSEGASGTEAFRWTTTGGMTGLGFLSGTDPFSAANGVSEDGSVVVGSSHDGSGVERAFRWSGGTMTELDGLSCSDCDPVTKALGVSGDGLVAVGYAAARTSSGPLHLDPVRWPGGGTGILDLGNLSASEEIGEAYGASPDGSLIVGGHNSADGHDAWSWSGSGLDALPRITGPSLVAANAFAISDDGSTIVGYSNKSTTILPGGTEVATDLQAVRWTGAGYATLSELGALPSAASTDSRALAVSADGALIVGQAVDADLNDQAFLWDAANGMRKMKTVLTDEYGLDLTGWILTEARGISDVVDGAFTVVGSGVNPQGEPEGWVAFLTAPACSDGDDNDTDTFTDHPADPECVSPLDWSEEPDCDDGIDNDGDGDVDFPADDGCLSATDLTEQPDCSDGIDNDGDGQADFPADLGCASPDSAREDPACQNGLDDDLDLATDFPADAQCTGPSDLSETPDCSDGLDNDGDGFTDHPADPECESASDDSEAGQCSDGIDNDGDGRIDYPEQYPGCDGPDDPIEMAQCSDGVDNDGDSAIDHPADTGCASPTGESESPVALGEGDLVAVDRATRSVFRVDTTTGAQTLVSQAALLSAPQGIAQRGPEIVVADPAGLVTVADSGAQRLASPPLVDNESLQVVVDEAGDAYVLEASEISFVDWSQTGVGAKSTWISVPTPEPLPLLGSWHGDTLAREPSGSFVTTGLSLYGDGVYRIDATATPSILKTGFENLRWLDLTIEADGTILAVGYKYDVAPGIYRVDPVTGDSTPLNNTYAWQMPTGVAVDGVGEIWVADSGVCADGLCTGGEVVHVDPTTGAVTPLSSGGLISGELDLVALPEAGSLPMLVAGVAGVAALARLRGSRRRR